jgi:RNA polymerase sigma-70 factor (ECF subfamily)
MKTTIKKDSEQATLDKACASILQDEHASSRDKEKAFNELYSRHNQQVRIHFLKKLREADVAEDLLMITFQKVHENINSYDDEYALSTWLYKIANHTLIDYTRKAKFEVLSLDALTGKTSEDNDGMDFQIDSGVKNPEEMIVHSEIIAEIHNAVYSLKSGKVRDMMICRYIKELSFEESAEELGLEANSTLRTTVIRGKEALRKKLGHLKQFA